jgi:rare lipoprotein A
MCNRSARTLEPQRAKPLSLGALSTALALLALAGCASRPGTSSTDRAPAKPPSGLMQVPDAQPRVEPLRIGGPNKPYEVAGQRYVPLTTDAPLQETGLASWYGTKFHGLPTSSGEPYDMYAMTAAHKTMPIPSYARVRNPANGREVVLRINDRGPFAPGRVIDLSYTAALKLGVLNAVAPVQVQRLTHAQIRAAQLLGELGPDALSPVAELALSHP